MSDTESRETKLWGGILDAPASDARTKAVKEAVEAGLVTFDEHKEALLDHLRTVSTTYFDADKSRDRLTRLAQAYFLRQAITPAAEREAGMRKFAAALGHARDLGEQVRQNDVGSDLFSEWFDGLPRDPRGQLIFDDDRSLRAVYFPEIDFKEMVAGLHAYQAAVLRAANDVPKTSPGRAAILPRLYIRALADTYREITGRNAGAGIGPFYKFVMKFRAALDPSYKTTDVSADERVDESVIDAIKDALRRPRAVMPLSGKQVKDRRRSTE